MEILPSLQGDLTTLDKIYMKSPTTGGEVPLSHLREMDDDARSSRCRSATRASSRRSPSASIWRPGVALGQATDGVQRAQSDLQLPADRHRQLPGQRAGVPGFAATVPLLILAALVVVYLILGILYESYIHPLTILSTLPSAGVGALATLMLFGFDFSLIALIGIILLIGIVKKNGIMMVDFAIVAERDEHLSPRRRDPQGGAAALPPDHDDDDGGDARRRAADARARAPARNCASRSATRWSAA
jgi:hydrophobic/amphiphilic exporter-1 (mainly G- bacteria), HAE1 family